MAKTASNHGIVLDEKAQEQPADKDRAQTSNKPMPSKASSEPKRQDEDDLQPLRDKSGF
jgi:hypothetical protein